MNRLKAFWGICLAVGLLGSFLIGAWLFKWMFIGLAYLERHLSWLEREHPIVNNLPFLITAVLFVLGVGWSLLKKGNQPK
jgi:hypothetical protein